MLQKFLLLLLLGITASLLTIDTVGSFDSSIRNVGINSTFVFILFLLMSIIWAFYNLYPFPKLLLEINKKIITPILTVLTMILVIVHYRTYDNFILATFHIHIETFILLALLSGSLTYINHSQNQTFSQKLVYFSGPILLIGFIMIDYFLPSVFKFLVAEDSILENLQFLIYLVSGLITSFVTFQFLKRKQLLNVFIFGILSFVLIVVAGEEISWGQRIFGIETPEVIADGNLQGELTIHNEGIIQRYIHFFYMSLGLFFSLSGVVLLKYFEKIKQKYHILIPSTLTFFSFFSIFVYYFLNQYLTFYYQIFSAQKIGLGRWQEVAEIFLTLGFLIFAISSYKKVNREPTFLNKPNIEDNPILD